MAIQKDKLGKLIILSCKIHMVEEVTTEGGSKGGGKRRVRRERVSLTQYLEFQED